MKDWLPRCAPQRHSVLVVLVRAQRMGAPPHSFGHPLVHPYEHSLPVLIVELAPKGIEMFLLFVSDHLVLRECQT